MSLSATSSRLEDDRNREPVGGLIAPDWTPEEEKRARRKVDFILIPLLMLGFFCLREYHLLHSTRLTHISS